MNMIIGPNGTGKSTIVCAIALGLGGAPNLLGRAKNIQEFVKTGEDEATIAIELKKVNDRNIVIQRSFKKSSNSTAWKVNGKGTTHKEVMSIIHGFNIQVDNLCQFLPQDRVAEFAEMSPTQLLEKTQSAAGEIRLYDMQKQLINWRNEQKNFEASHKSDVEHLNTLKDRNKKLEQDVMRMQLKQKILDKIKLLKAQQPLVQYSQARKELEEYSELVSQQKEVVQKVNKEYAPLQEILKGYETDLKNLLLEKNNESKAQQEKSSAMKTLLVKINSLRDKIRNAKQEIKSIENRIPEKQQKMRVLQNRIKEYEEEISQPPNTDTSDIESSIAEINEKLSVKKYDLQKLTDKARVFGINKREEMGELDVAKKKIEDMKNVRNIRLQALKNRHADTFTAFEWLRANRDQFTGRVYNPILLELNLKDSKYAAHIEQVLGGQRSNIFRTFVFEQREDYLKFNRIIINEKKLRVTTAWPDQFPNNVLKTPTSAEELRQRFKLEHYMVDLLQAPEFLLKYLCLEKKINLVPVSLQMIDEERIVNSGVFRKFTAAQNYYNVKPNKYSNNFQTEVNVLRPAQLLNDSIDSEFRSSLIEKCKTHHANILQCDQDTKELAKEAESIKQTIQELESEKNDLQHKKRDVVLDSQKYERAKRLLEQKLVEFRELENEPEKDKARIDQFKAKLQELLDEETVTLLRFTDLSHDLAAIFKSHSRRQLEVVETSARYETMKLYIRSQQTALNEAQSMLAGYKREHDARAKRVSIYMTEARNAGRGLSGELKDAFKEIVTQFKDGGETEFKTLEELGLKIAEKEGEADAINFANPNAMKHYEERVAEIEKLNAKIEGDQKNMESLDAKIAGLKGRWEPSIDGLVARISEKFSEAFERIGCTGEVGIEKHPDFDKWGIQILVKFRETEKLQILTGQRQSGGERSVSTILYLMSLQNLAKSPFRVVDEINQGMDPRNERMIHEQIVQGASRSGTSQYFLITPKLLPDLYYNEQIRVLCIYNGEWVPTKMNPLAKYLEHARANPTLIH
ncbi:unnamed protein product [Rhizopus stolonifer]